MTTFKKTIRRVVKKFHKFLGTAAPVKPRRKYVRKAKVAVPAAQTTTVEKADPILGG